jgi:hypothetical protein
MGMVRRKVDAKWWPARNGPTMTASSGSKSARADRGGGAARKPFEFRIDSVQECPHFNRWARSQPPLRGSAACLATVPGSGM